MATATGNRCKVTVSPGNQELLIEREFDAPRELVFKAHIDPKLYAQWIGPRGLTTKIDRFDSRNGGSWRFMQMEPDGKKHCLGRQPPERRFTGAAWPRAGTRV